jgi:uncharacterized protein
MMRLVGLPFLLTLLAVLPAAAGAPGLTGTWVGVWTRDGDSLPVTMSFEKTASNYIGYFDSDALQVAGIPLNSIRDRDGQVHFEIKGDATTPIYDGVLSGDVLAGNFSDGGAQGTFRLNRAQRPRVRVLMREVLFKSGRAQLSGTLFVPSATGRHHAIAFLHGSGPEGRWANRYLAQRFAEAGVVALIYDKRGVGQSTGDWRKAGFDTLAADAAAAIALLRAQPEVDAKHVGIYGHSQGGTMAPLVADRAGALAFIIASAAGGTDPAEVETYSVSNAIAVGELPDAERADAASYVRIVIDVAYHGGDRSLLERAAARYKGRSWYFDPPPPDNVYWLLARDGYQPSAYWSKVKAPVFLVYGAHDERVPPNESIAAITAALKSGGNSNITVKLYPDADHTFTVTSVVGNGGWPKHESDYAATLIAWVRAH